mmetsp:Transcript_41273/g.39747  ORF Transcript_41273/g.39747 Transcript_41273/m.39747 type:complete len:158 (+) Transcript_41273:1-474(+)
MKFALKGAVLLVLLEVSLQLKLLNIEREMLKDGLHKDLVTTVALLFHDPLDLQRCSLIFREDITKDIYVYVEEVEGMKGFEFWPLTPIDVERPSSASERHEFLYRVPLHNNNKPTFEWQYGQLVTGYEVKEHFKKPNNAPDGTRLDIKFVYPLHFRY